MKDHLGTSLLEHASITQKVEGIAQSLFGIQQDSFPFEDSPCHNGAAVWVAASPGIATANGTRSIPPQSDLATNRAPRGCDAAPRLEVPASWLVVAGQSKFVIAIPDVKRTAIFVSIHVVRLQIDRFLKGRVRLLRTKHVAE